MYLKKKYIFLVIYVERGLRNFKYYSHKISIKWKYTRFSYFPIIFQCRKMLKSSVYLIYSIIISEQDIAFYANFWWILVWLLILLLTFFFKILIYEKEHWGRRRMRSNDLWYRIYGLNDLSSMFWKARECVSWIKRFLVDC